MANILLVDDHPLFRDSLIRSAFPALGWVGAHRFDAIKEADSLEAALIIQPQNDDLAIIDVLLPTQSHVFTISHDDQRRQLGLQVAEKWRSVARQLAIIFFSGATDLGMPIQNTIARIGAYRIAYLPKGDMTIATLKDAFEAIQQGLVYLHPALVNEKYPEAARTFLHSRPAQTRQWIEIVYERLPLLTPRERQVLSLKMQGHTAKAIGHRLSIKHGTVSDYINKARAKLLESLDVYRTTVAQAGPDALIRDALILHDLIPPSF